MGMKHLVMLDRKEGSLEKLEKKDRSGAEDSKLAWHKPDGSKTRKLVL